jgi:hypothetical protein
MGKEAPIGSPRYCPNRNPPAWLWPGYHCRQDRDLRIRYGITCEDYWGLFERQRRRCAVCGRPPGAWRLAVDHDHDSGLVRGLAHSRCQRWITTAVVRYLADPPGREVGLVVPAAKLRRLEAVARVKKAKAKARAEERARAKEVEEADGSLGSRIATERRRQAGG